jgi:SAM-dependent methyltransferase
MLVEWISYGVIFFLASTFLVVSLGMFAGALWAAPCVPSGKKTVQKMIRAACITPSDIVYDLGCGDGRFVFAAAKAGAKKTVGIEISPLVFLYAKFRSWFLGTKNSAIRFGNFFHFSEVKDADVLFLFLLPNILEEVFREIWPHLKPGTRVISNSFFPEHVSPKVVIPKDKGGKKIYVYVKK